MTAWRVRFACVRIEATTHDGVTCAFCMCENCGSDTLGPDTSLRIR